MMAAGNADESGNRFSDLLHGGVVTLERLIVVLLPGGHFTQSLVDLFEAFIELFLAGCRLFEALSDALEDPFNAVKPFAAVCHFKNFNTTLPSTAA